MRKVKITIDIPEENEDIHENKAIWAIKGHELACRCNSFQDFLFSYDDERDLGPEAKDLLKKLKDEWDDYFAEYSGIWPS